VRPLHRPALAPAPVPSEAEIDREDQPPASGGSETVFVDLGFKRLSLCPKAPRTPQPKPANSAFPTLRPRSFNGLGFGLLQGEPWCFPLLIPRPRGSRHRVSAVPKSLLLRRPQSFSREQSITESPSAVASGSYRFSVLMFSILSPNNLRTSTTIQHVALLTFSVTLRVKRFRMVLEY
jgi:hypothetical protein